jgi:hypothetical protein
MRSGYRVLVVSPKGRKSFGDIGVEVNNNPKGKLKRTENTCWLHVSKVSKRKAIPVTGREGP